MGYTLDQLLDETGARGLSAPSRMDKTAAPVGVTTFAKLAERCRRAIETPSATADSDRLMAEKTASIAIIQRTMQEIEAIDGGLEKVAYRVVPDRREVFIKTALEKGHSPAAIAEFLEKNAGLGKMIMESGLGRRAEQWGAARNVAKAGRTIAKGEGQMGKAFRTWQDMARKAERLGPEEKAAFVSKMRVHLNDDQAHAVLRGVPHFHGEKAYKDLAKTVEGNEALKAGKGLDAEGKVKKNLVNLNIGGNNLGVTGAQLNKMKMPALAVGAGYLGHRALSSKDDSKRRGGVTVVNT